MRLPCLVPAISGVSVLGVLLTTPGAMAGLLPVDYSTSGGEIFSIGNTINNTQGPFDILNLSAFSGTIGASGIYDLNPATFTAGPNTFLSTAFTASGSLSETITINGISQVIDIPYVATINALRVPLSTTCAGVPCTISAFSDEIQIVGGETFAFGPNVQMTLDSLLLPVEAFNSNHTGSASGFLTADVVNATPDPTANAVPEPATLVLLGPVLLALGGALSRAKHVPWRSASRNGSRAPNNLAPMEI